MFVIAKVKELDMPHYMIKGSYNAEGAKALMAEGGTARLEQAKACLLYTSPSPRDPKTSRMPSSA